MVKRKRKEVISDLVMKQSIKNFKYLIMKKEGI